MTAHLATPANPPSSLPPGCVPSGPVFDDLRHLFRGRGIPHGKVGFFWINGRDCGLYMSSLHTRDNRKALREGVHSQATFDQLYQAIELPLLEILSPFRVPFGSTMVHVYNDIPKKIVTKNTIKDGEFFPLQLKRWY